MDSPIVTPEVVPESPLDGMFWTLDEYNRPVVCTDTIEWAQWYENATVTGRRFVAKDEIEGDALVSTVFLSISPVLSGGELFETMVFGPVELGTGEFQFRYATWEAAEAGHALILEEVWALILWEMRPGEHEQTSLDDLYDRLEAIEL